MSKNPTLEKITYWAITDKESGLIIREANSFQMKVYGKKIDADYNCAKINMECPYPYFKVISIKITKRNKP